MDILRMFVYAFFGGLFFESNGDAQKVEVRPARADNGKPNRRAASRYARKD